MEVYTCKDHSYVDQGLNRAEQEASLAALSHDEGQPT